MLDLGTGAGALLGVAVRRWPDIRVVGADLNADRFVSLSAQYPNIRLIKTDSLYAHTCPRFAVEPGSIDIAVCNPPYLKLPDLRPFIDLMKGADLPSCLGLNRITSDVVFLAQNLRFLRNGGELGIIVPDRLATGRYFTSLRRDLIERHELFGVIAMPPKVFRGTEATTHIFLLRRGGSSADKIPLYQADAAMTLSAPLFVKRNDAALRCDYPYWSWVQGRVAPSLGLTLATVGAEIKRGTITRAVCLERGLPHFHTSDFPDQPGQEIHFPEDMISTRHLAERGDILLARVGTRCMGKIAIVTCGSRIFTDCVYRIRVPQRYVAPLLQSLASEKGRQWINAHAHGVCAKVLSKIDLLEFVLS